MPDIDPLEYVESEDDERTAGSEADRRKSQLNALIAITVALLATFLGICQVKAGNVAQAMAQAQAKSNDHWAWYQFRKVRFEIFKATADQLDLQSRAAPADLLPAFTKQVSSYRAQAKEQEEKQKETKEQAERFDKQYDALNVHDDQFDLAEAFISLALALLALTALTQKRWLYGLALLPTVLGVWMGLAGLLNWSTKLEAFTRLLS